MTKVGKGMGVKIKHMLTPMDEPLGRTVGNALEVAESVEVLQGGGPTDLIDLTLDLAELVSTVSRKQLASWLHDGTAWRKFVALVYAQDGDASTLERITEVHRAPIIYPLLAPTAGIVKKWMQKQSVALPFSSAAAGKDRTTQSISPSVFLASRKSANALKRANRSCTSTRAPIKRWHPCSPFWKKRSWLPDVGSNGRSFGLASIKVAHLQFANASRRHVLFRFRASSNLLRKRAGYCVADTQIARRHAHSLATAGRSRPARNSV